MASGDKSVGRLSHDSEASCAVSMILCLAASAVSFRAETPTAGCCMPPQCWYILWQPEDARRMDIEAS